MEYHNIAEYGVKQLANAIKISLEDNFGYIRLRGEVTGFKKHSSGHLYFNLCEKDAIVNAVCFRNNASKINFAIADGLQIIASGKISGFEGRSNYQIIVDKIEISGLGAILAMIEKRKEKLTKQGLFDQIHKKKLPFMPQIIAIITSPTGAVIEDIKNSIRTRFPCHLKVYASKMQGVEAVKSVIDGIKYFNRSKIKPDVIIIARGGGSFEDLMPFNDEELILEVFKSNIPVISAIGHQTDNSLLDLVADVRAQTPTAAAEIATPSYNDLRQKLLSFYDKVSRLYLNITISKEEKLVYLTKYYNNFSYNINYKYKIFSDLVNKISLLSYHKMNYYSNSLKIFAVNIAIIKNLSRQQSSRLIAIFNQINQQIEYQIHKNISNIEVFRKINNSYLNNLQIISKNLNSYQFNQNILNNYSSHYNNLVDNIIGQINIELNEYFVKLANKLTNIVNRINSYNNYQSNLEAGFAIILDDHNKIIRSVNQLQDCQVVNVKFIDGDRKMMVNKS